jgi:dTDP-glucose 4,6-dehydratase
MTTLITGGLGFIGSNLVIRHLNKYPNDHVVVVDNFSYAANQSNLDGYLSDWRLTLVNRDIRNYHMMDELYKTIQPEITFHLAAESHVDNSIANDDNFVSTNILGTHNILKCIKKYGGKLVHVSTDEVFGSLSYYDIPSNETTTYNPRNPYSATKAASDHLVNAYRETYGIDAAVTNCGNNYGPRQHGEKYIPTIIRNALKDAPIPIYGNGMNIRDWIFVEDHCDALLHIATGQCAATTGLDAGRLGNKYVIGARNETSNLVVAEMILDILEKPHDLIQFVKDRQGHDFRYSLSPDRIEMEYDWTPTVSFRDGLIRTVEWYKNA